MTNKLSKLLIGTLLIFGLLPFSNIAADTTDNSNDVDELKSELLYYYGEHAQTDVLRTLDKMKAQSEEDYQIWKSVIDEWGWIENDMEENVDVAPDGLPEDDTHAFVVLGFALDNNGEMKDELIGRLEVALNSAEKYPNAYVLVTGGVEKNGWTEGERMRDWLIDHGISEDRIIVEKEAPNTVGNAANSFKIMYNDYDIESFSMITSQYHLKRGSIFYYTMSQLKAKEYGKTPIEMIGEGNAGWYREDKTEESWSLKVRGMYQIADVKKSEDLPISILEDLHIKGDMDYTLNQALNLEVYAQYDNGYQRDVTDISDISGYDSSVTGDQELDITYQENDTVINKQVEVHVKAPTLDSMQEQVISLQNEGEFANDGVVRSLTTHLAAVKQFDETSQTVKVMKHLEGFQNLLDYQRNKESISAEAYELLEQDTDYLIDQAS